jgi:hypothetical protein
MGHAFDLLPKVLTINICRFDQDQSDETLIKRSERFEFAERIRLRDSSYQLSSVIVHAGSAENGRFVAFIRFNRHSSADFFRSGTFAGNFYRVEDEDSWAVPEKDAFDFHNVTHLCYVREDESDLHQQRIDVPPSLAQQFLLCEVRIREARTNALSAKLKKTSSMHFDFFVATAKCVADIKSYTLKDDFVATGKVLKVERDCQVWQLMLQIEAEMGIPVKRQRLWKIIKRANNTRRVGNSLDLSLGAIVSRLGTRVFLEVLGNEMAFAEDTVVAQVRPYHSDAIEPPAEILPKRQVEQSVVASELTENELRESHALMFFKLYDPNATPKLRYVGSAYVNNSADDFEISDLESFLQKLTGIEGPLRLVDQVMLNATMELDRNELLCGCNLEVGDIICFQKAPTAQAIRTMSTPDSSALSCAVQGAIEPVSVDQTPKSSFPATFGRDVFEAATRGCVETDNTVLRPAPSITLPPQPAIDAFVENCTGGETEVSAVTTVSAPQQPASKSFAPALLPSETSGTANSAVLFADQVLNCGSEPPYIEGLPESDHLPSTVRADVALKAATCKILETCGGMMPTPSASQSNTSLSQPQANYGTETCTMVESVACLATFLDDAATPQLPTCEQIGSVPTKAENATTAKQPLERGETTLTTSPAPAFVEDYLLRRIPKQAPKYAKSAKCNAELCKILLDDLDKAANTGNISLPPMPLAPAASEGKFCVILSPRY